MRIGSPIVTRVAALAAALTACSPSQDRRPSPPLSHAPSPTLVLIEAGAPPARVVNPDPIQAARSFRLEAGPVQAVSDSTVIAEAEEFKVESAGWQARAFGTNYYAATFANCFLSRKAYLGAPDQGGRTVASIEVNVPRTGRYLALVRYEAVYRFETQFHLAVAQKGKSKLDRLYGARQNLKIWAFGKKLEKELTWDWGASESVVWEGHDAGVDLEEGIATLTLVADAQPSPAARRNIDLVMLTSDTAQVERRIEKENYLPLDGMLTQAGDVYLRAHNHKDSAALTLTVPNGIEHSPYWVHQRDWKPKTIEAAPGASTPWIEVGSLLDSLSDGQWNLAAVAKGPLHFDVETGVRDASNAIVPLRRFDDQTGNVALTYSADTRYSRRMGTPLEVLSGLVDFLKAQPSSGVAPTRTMVFATTFGNKPEQTAYNTASAEFDRLVGISRVLQRDEAANARRGFIDVRYVPTEKLEAYGKKMQAEGTADAVDVVSMGDEINLGVPPENDHAGFRAWLRAQKIAPHELDAVAGGDFEKLKYSPTPENAKRRPALYYQSNIYKFRFGIRQLKERTDILRRYFPRAGMGANFSPHRGSMYLGPTHQWISLFREGGMTMPWGEDYVFQVPVVSPQVNSLMVDMFRAAIRDSPEAKIHYYVMAHTPNNTVNAWRRQFYGDIAHGVKIFNLFEFRPVEAAYTENHVNDPRAYQAVREGLHELGGFEDIVQAGHVTPGVAALWFSEAADIWDDNHEPFGAHKRALYVAIRQQQLSLDVVVEGDPLQNYKVLYLTDRHVSRVASKAIDAWVKAGGQLIASAGAGMFDELDRPNLVLRALFGVRPTELAEDKDNVVRLEKQDLPFAGVMDSVHLEPTGTAPVIGVRSRFTADKAIVTARFDDSSPAVTSRTVGTGKATYMGFLPGLAYFKPAIPMRPFDRGTTDDAMVHFLPTAFDPGVAHMIGALDVERPIECSETRVESTLISAKEGALLTLINWTSAPIKGLTVTIHAAVPTHEVKLASGRPVKTATDSGRTTFTLDLDVADAVILR